MTDLTLRAALAEKIKRLAYEMSGQDVSAVLAPTGLSRQAHKYAMDTAKEFESAVDELAALAAAPESGEPLALLPGWVRCPDCHGSAEHVYNDRNGDPEWDYAVPCPTCTEPT